MQRTVSTVTRIMSTRKKHGGVPAGRNGQKLGDLLALGSLPVEQRTRTSAFSVQRGVFIIFTYRRLFSNDKCVYFFKPGFSQYTFKFFKIVLYLVKLRFLRTSFFICNKTLQLDIFKNVKL